MPYANVRVATLKKRLHELIRAFEAVKSIREAQEYENTLREIEMMIMKAQRETRDDGKLFFFIMSIEDALASLIHTLNKEHDAEVDVFAKGTVKLMQKTLHNYTQK